MEGLDNQYERKKNLAARKINYLGQRLLSYEEGFTWCPKCHYVSNISLQSELRHTKGLKGCQRRSCEGCYQWSKFDSPYEDEDFLYEGPKTQRICEAYSKGTVGCTEENKCLDYHEKWDEKDQTNKNRCYVCGMTPNQRDSHKSNYCTKLGGRK